MTTETLKLSPQTMSGLGRLYRGLVLVGVLVLGGVLIYANYWLGIVFLFAALLVFILVGFKKYQNRNLWLLVYAHLLLLMLLTNVIYPFLLNDPAARQLTQTNRLANALWSSELGAFLSALLFSLIGAVLIVAVPFFAVLAAAAVLIWGWHKSKGLSYLGAFLHLVRAVLGLAPFLVVVDDVELDEEDEEVKRLNIFGGPGWLVVDSGYVVVLQHQGKIVRAVGRGSTYLNREEKIKAILPLDTCTHIHSDDEDEDGIKALTRDRIPLSIKMIHVAKLESAKETEERYQQAIEEAEAHLKTLDDDQEASEGDKKSAKQDLEKAKKKLEQLKDGPTIGDDFDQVYESIAIVAAKRSPKIKGAFKGKIESNLRDIIMSTYSEELFTISGDYEDLENKINERKIAEIEEFIREKVKDSKLGDGVRFKALDIQGVKFPDELQKKINEEVETLIQERIEQTKARIENSKAKGTVVAARAKAQARILEGQSEGEAQAALFREILRELREEGIDTQEEVTRALIQLISSTVSIKELQSFFKATASSRDLRSISSPDTANGSQQD